METARTVLLILLVAAIAGCQHVPPRPLAPDRAAAAFDARRLDDPDLESFINAVLGRPPQWPPRVWDFRTLTLAALYFQPRLDVVRAHADVARAAIETAGARPNPTLSVAPQLVANPQSGVSPWLTTVNLDWPIETAGKRARRLEHAEALAAAADAAVTFEAWRTRRELASAVVALAAARRQQESITAEIAVHERLVGLVEQRIRDGAAAATDAAPLRLALLQASSERAVLDAQLGDAFARVAAAIGVPSAALMTLELPTALDDADTNALLAVSAAEARRRALLERADVRQALSEYAAAEATLRLELARQYPDLRLGPSYEFDQGANKWGFVLAVDVPIMNRNEGPIAEAVATRAEAAAKFGATQASAIADLEQALARRNGQRARQAHAQAVVRDREANLRRATRALNAGAVDRTAALTADLERLRALREEADAQSGLQQALVDLESAIEGPLPDIALDDAAIGKVPGSPERPLTRADAARTDGRNE